MIIVPADPVWQLLAAGGCGLIHSITETGSRAHRPIGSRAVGAATAEVLVWKKSACRHEAAAIPLASANETELEMVRRHIREGAGQLASQRFLIARMRMNGILTEEAERLLLAFEDTLKQHDAHLPRIDDATVAKPGSGMG
ncbi:hypothetical protein MKK88_33130 [Methylobacterium sp. E-005]|uniref:hypothetical protein n=1 Tax=Methylobacterium sp. E-005 TaxID=2836549 RepID=UPI001FB8C461|nr:hypothetical protein [Methylobacterium sp. E-005]MCJ2090791.1 hypothetical protein [Methylobacterium sp. E-005]